MRQITYFCANYCIFSGDKTAKVISSDGRLLFHSLTFIWMLKEEFSGFYEIVTLAGLTAVIKLLSVVWLHHQFFCLLWHLLWFSVFKYPYLNLFVTTKRHQNICFGLLVRFFIWYVQKWFNRNFLIIMTSMKLTFQLLEYLLEEIEKL